MYLFETKEGDKWVCITCGREQAEMIEAEGWEYILEEDSPLLRCALCKGPDYEYEF